MHPNKCLFGVGHVIGAVGILYLAIILSRSFYNLFLGDSFFEFNTVMFLFLLLILFIYVLCNISLFRGIEQVS